MDNEEGIIYGTGCNALILPAKKPSIPQPKQPVERPIGKRTKRAMKKMAEKERMKRLRSDIQNDLLNLVAKTEDSDVVRCLSWLMSSEAMNGSNTKYLSVYKKLIEVSPQIIVPSTVLLKVDSIKARIKNARHTETTNVDDEGESVNLTDKEDLEGVVVVGTQKSSDVGINLSIATRKEGFAGKRAGNSDSNGDIDIEIDYVPDKVDTIKRDWHNLLCPVHTINRSSAITSMRTQLPSLEFESEIVESSLEHIVSIITGGTGCGKSTQIPQFLYERGFCLTHDDKQLKIGITQPRRVAATSIALRLREELCEHGKHVSYQIRNDYNRSGGTELLHVFTEGILLNILKGDILLSEYSVIIIDEVHERSVNCDLILSVLNKVVNYRLFMWESGSSDLPPLRIVLMSATLCVKDFINEKPTALFNTLVVNEIHIPSKMHPVSIHFEKNSPVDYVNAAVRKIRRIHNELPAGSILVFLSGKQDISKVKDLIISNSTKESQGHVLDNNLPEDSDCSDEDEDEDENEKNGPQESNSVRNVIQENNISSPSDMFSLDSDGKSQTLISTTIPDMNELKDTNLTHHEWLGGGASSDTLTVIPLYSALDPGRQREVFRLPLPGERIVILATNIAETSVTLPNIRYVIDCGYSKQRIYNQSGSISSFRVCRISKANCAQRTGRAGRVGPGHCYRLFTSSVFQYDMPDYPPNEIENTSLDGLILYLSSLGVKRVKNIDFPTQMSTFAIESAVNRLQWLQLIKPDGRALFEYEITEKGERAANMNVDPISASIFIRIIDIFNRERDVRILILGALSICGMCYGSEIYNDIRKGNSYGITAYERDDFDILWRTIIRLIHVQTPTEEHALMEDMGINAARYRDLLVTSLQLIIGCSEYYHMGGEDNDDHRLSPRFAKGILSRNNHNEIRQWFETLVTGGKLDAYHSIIKTCISVDYAFQLATRVCVMRPLSSAAIARLSKADYKRYKLGFITNNLPPDQISLVGSTSKLTSTRPWPQVIVFTTHVERDGSWVMRNIIIIDDPRKIGEILRHENRPNSLLSQYLDL